MLINYSVFFLSVAAILKSTGARSGTDKSQDLGQLLQLENSQTLVPDSSVPDLAA